MKIQIRKGVFETNSSSVHSITMCSDDDYNKWKKGEILLNKWEDTLISLEDAIIYANKEGITDITSEEFKHQFLDYERFNSYSYMEYEMFEDAYKTSSGEIVHAFGYYGHD